MTTIVVNVSTTQLNLRFGKGYTVDVEPFSELEIPDEFAHQTEIIVEKLDGVSVMYTRSIGAEEDEVAMAKKALEAVEADMIKADFALNEARMRHSNLKQQHTRSKKKLDDAIKKLSELEKKRELEVKQARKDALNKEATLLEDKAKKVRELEKKE